MRKDHDRGNGGEAMIVVGMAGIALLAVVLALWPLWARAPGGGPRRRALNVAGYEGRLAEIDAELAAGTLTPEAAQALRDEAAARLLADTGTDAAPAPATRSVSARSRGLALGAAAFIVGVSVLGYWFGDSRQQAAWIAEARADPQAAQRLAVDSMVQRLEARLQNQPGDAEGWAMLGRSYVVMGRHAEAAAAYERANRLVAAAPRADWLADEAEVRTLLQGHDFRGLPRQLFERALAIEPEQPKALWYAGLAAAQAGDYAVAVERWIELRAGDLPEEFRAVLDERLQELGVLAGVDAPSLPPLAPAAPASSVPGAAQLVLDLELADGLGVAASDTLFVIARRPDASGPPLAVRRLGAAALPLRVTLDDSHAMAPGMNLSAAERWEVVARISRSGAPQAQSGDLEGRVVVDAAQARTPIRLRIEQRIP
jgi:cytochrome c-type biogenesis protein CcmH